MTASPLIDMRSFATELRERRNKAAMVLTPDIQKQREYAQQLAAATDGFHLDVLDYFRTDKTLTANLVTFTMADFFALVASFESKKLVILSGIEFLLGAWLSMRDPRQVKFDLCKQVELWEKRPAFILVTQYEPALTDYEPERHSSPIIFEVSKTLSLE
jgi:hypothetical protein